MNLARQLEKVGLRVYQKDVDSLTLAGLKTLDPEIREWAVSFARQHKTALLQELSEPPEPPPAPGQIGHSIKAHKPSGRSLDGLCAGRLLMLWPLAALLMSLKNQTAYC